MTANRPLRLAAVAAALALLFTACGREDEASDSTDDSTATTAADGGTDSGTDAPKAFINPEDDCTDYQGTKGIEGDTIKIGTVRPESGPYSIYDTVTKGLEAYVGSINAKGGVKAGDGKPGEVRLRRHIGAMVDCYYNTPYLNRLLMRLVRDADVLVHNFRPSVAPRLGIGYEQLAALNPRLIYCAVSGYGDTGPLAEKAGYDQVLQTMTGICTLQGRAEGPPEIVYGSVVDYYAAVLVAAGVASALYERERSGQGQRVGVSLLRSALAMQSTRMVWAEGEPRDVGRDMRSGGITGLHPTRQGHLYISANTPHFWRALCDRIGLPALADDARYDSVRKRAERQAELLPLLHQALQGRTALEWESVFGDEVPCAAARTVEDMFDHPQVQAQGLVTEFEHPQVGRYRGFCQPVEFSRTPGPDPFAAPTLGQHSDAVRQGTGG